VVQIADGVGGALAGSSRPPHAGRRTAPAAHGACTLFSPAAASLRVFAGAAFLCRYGDLPEMTPPWFAAAAAQPPFPLQLTRPDTDAYCFINK
jgi:hypothetical protein